MNTTKALQTPEECFETACRILSPALTMALAMGSIDGPPNMVADIQRGLDIMNLGLNKKNGG